MTSTLPNIPMNLILLLIPVLLIQLGLQIYCIIDLVKRRTVKYGNKAIWALVILLVNLIGPIVYLVMRGDGE